MSKLWSTLVVFAVLAFVGSAYAQEAPKKKGGEEGKRPPIKQIFKKLDADGNGKLTAEELVKSPMIKDEAKAKEVAACLSIVGIAEPNLVRKPSFGSVCAGMMCDTLCWELM